MHAPALVVIAKAPVPGLVKTRLTPPCTPRQAAALARAALLDTLAALARVAARRHVLVLDGDPGELGPPAGFELLPQRGEGLGERLQAAFEDVGEPALLVGMDTPQLTPALLRRAAAELAAPGVDAVLGPAADGGFWAIGFRAAPAGAFDGVPMSRSDTCARQRARLNELGLRVCEQPQLRDIDTIADARAVAREAPGTRFAAALARVA